MVKRNKLVFIILIISIVSVIIGLLLGKIIFNKSVDSTTTDNSYSEAQNDDENKYPFSLYSSFLANSSGKVIDELNNNPIDKMYYDKYVNCSTPDEEQDVLSNWNKAYENEFNNAKTVLKKLINEKNSGNDISTEDALRTIEDYVNSSSTYAEATAQLSYNFEEYNLGHGTNHTYDLLLNSLEINRMNTLHLIECIYMCNESYTWLK